MTSDGGGNWRQVAISGEGPFGGPFKDVFFVGDAGWIVGGEGLILHSNDGGKTWNKQSSGVQETLLKVFFLNRDKGFTVGGDGTILKTDNGGTSWESVAIDWMEILPEDLIEQGAVSVNLYGIFFSDELSGCIVGDFGTVLTTADGGKLWSLSNIGFLPSLFSVYFKNKREGWAVGQNGFCLKTDNGGRSWEKGSVETEESLYGIFLRGDYGVIVGDHGLIIKTNDGGTTWVNEIAPNLRAPFPWLVDACILLNAGSAKVIGIGKGLMLKTEIFPGK
jgi:photosystem II stability/assembly factor-like uncharacterized protein